MSLFLPMVDDRAARLRSPLAWPLYVIGPSTALAGGIVLGFWVYLLILGHEIAFTFGYRMVLWALMVAAGFLTASVALMLARQVALPLRNHIFLLPCAVVWFDAHVLRVLILGYAHAPGWPLSWPTVTLDTFTAAIYAEWLGAVVFTIGCVLLALRLRRPESHHSDGNGSLWVVPSRRRALAGAVPARPPASPAPVPAAAAPPAQPAPPAPLAAPPAPPGCRNPAVAPRLSFAVLYGNDDFKAALLDDARRWREGIGKTDAEGCKNGILLFGPPGTGKTAFAEALAAEIHVRFIKSTFGSVASRWVNQSTEQVRETFGDALKQAPCVLFVDEADAVLKSRDMLEGQPAEYGNIVDEFLSLAQSIRGSGVLLVAATNYVDHLDMAAIREGRFDFRHEVPLPDAEAREGLLRHGLNAGHCTTDAATMARLVRRWGGFNVPRLLACADGACEIGRIRQGLPERSGANEPGAPATLTYDDFYRALRKLQGRRGGAPEGAKALSELFMDPATSGVLANLKTQLVEVDRMEDLGGELPKGILFCGPPGTGKTATAMALARECGWSFLSRTGRELLNDGAVARLRQEASDLRPVIVFIDEADDILGNRQLSPYKAATNDLLTLIDGASGMLADVVWIAATNHPESMDAAALRGGRFGRKIVFTLPSVPTIARIVADWVRRKLAADGVRLDAPAPQWVAHVSAALAGLAPSDIYQILTEANTAVIAAALGSGGDPVLGVAAIAARRNGG